MKQNISFFRSINFTANIVIIEIDFIQSLFRYFLLEKLRVFSSLNNSCCIGEKPDEPKQEQK